MPQFNPISAGMRISNDKERICSVLGVAHDVSAQTAVNFVNAIQTIYGNGDCTARLSITMDLVQ